VSCFFVVVVVSYSCSSAFLEQLFLPPIGRRITGRGPWTCPFDHSCARDSHQCHGASLRNLWVAFLVFCKHKFPVALRTSPPPCSIPPQLLPIMSPSLLNSPKRLFTSTLVAAAAILIVVLIPCPVSAMPITALEPTPSSPPSPDLSMNDKVTFDIVFGLGKSNAHYSPLDACS
jgi:hypothetical protein